MEYYIVDGELRHHGTKGMKWGRRRYQNPDGSLTALGRIRYGAGKAGDAVGKAVKGAYQKHKTKVANKKESERIEKLMKKPIKKLTEAELAERTALATKQKNLRQIESDSARLMENGKTFAAKFGSKMVNDALVPGLTAAGKKIVENFMVDKIEKLLGTGSGANARKALEALKGDFDKLTDTQAKALREREKDINTARQQREQRERVGGDDKPSQNGSDDKPNQNESDDKPGNGSASKPQQNTGSKTKKNNKKTSKQKSEAVEPDDIRRESKANTGTKGQKWGKRKVVELTDDDVVVRRSSTEIIPTTVNNAQNSKQYRLGQRHVLGLPAPRKKKKKN